ncbi:hypothetical protein Taro_026840 [Colocasia esculenta]|uniref:Saposin B-type domain-containing protein n=1 Tax=Colocasia esculenta TaxID=4460 RepID=A0A843VGC7_COLES|nr:hypothetical protein [Colocasia esculenta]
MGNNNRLPQMNVVTTLSINILLLSIVKVYAIRRDNFIPLVEGFSGQKNHSLNDILTKYNCHSCLNVTEEDEEILIGQEVNEEIHALSNVMCSKVSSSLEIKQCMLMTQRYLRKASSCFEIFIIGENACRDKGLSAEISRTFQLPNSMENESFFTSKLGEGLLKELLKGLLMHTLEHKEYKSCAPCRNAVEDIHSAVGNTERQIMIIKLLHEVCDVSDTYAAQCKKMVLMYGPLLLGNVQKMVTETDLCYMTHMCKDPLPPPKQSSPPSPSKPEVTHDYI